MLYKDRIYGEINIIDPVVLDLISCPEMQRLKDIDQVGYFEPFFPGTKHSRFEHSLGVYILLNIYKASREEQIAGLIHDVSHSVFSHCIDYILEEGSPQKHDHQDNVFYDFVMNSSILKVLERHGIETSFILDDKNFPLKEKELPELCADRVDYLLRTAVIYEEINRMQLEELLENLVVTGRDWAFKGYKFARQFAELFCLMNKVYYSGRYSAIMFQAVGDCMRHALAERFIRKEDLYATDQAVLKKIEINIPKDQKLKKLWNRMNNRTEVYFDDNDFEAEVVCKSRVVDPLFLHDSELRKISDVEKDWRDVVKKEMQPKVYRLKFKD